MSISSGARRDTESLRSGPCETLVLAQGSVFGAGADIVASCSWRLAAPDAVFLMPGLRFGVVLGTRRFASRVGDDAARDILSASRSFDAQEALRIGFLTQIAEKQQWEDISAAAGVQSRKLAVSAAEALREATLRDTRSVDMAALARSVSAPGLKERIRAFRKSQERRPAK